MGKLVDSFVGLSVDSFSDPLLKCPLDGFSTSMIIRQAKKVYASKQSTDYTSFRIEAQLGQASSLS